MAMYRSAYDLKGFYNGKVGSVVKRILRERVRDMWPDVHGLSVMGCGYAVPILKIFHGEAERVVAMMPVAQSAHHWPSEAKNLVCLSEEQELPFENASIDRIILVHHVEYCEQLRPALEEVWRVLKANGRLLVIVPNRRGLWARADWSPFGQGTPYTSSQITNFLHDNRFVHERTEQALFLPPLKFSLALRSASVLEVVGRRFLPFMAGVFMVEASKQLYARAVPGGGSRVTVRDRGMLPGRAMPVPQGFSSPRQQEH